MLAVPCWCALLLLHACCTAAAHSQSRLGPGLTNTLEVQQPAWDEEGMVLTAEQEGLLSAALLGTQQQQNGHPAVQQQKSTMAPVVNGWSNLRTTCNTIFTWGHQLFPLASSSLQMPWGWGSAIAHARATFTRSVASAQYYMSGTLQVTNPDAVNPMWLSRLQLQCYWGANVNLPCGNSGWQYGSMQIAPGQTASCFVSNLPLQAAFGADFRQPCRVITTAWNGVETKSGDFILDFGSPTVNNQVRCGGAVQSSMMAGAQCTDSMAHRSKHNSSCRCVLQVHICFVLAGGCFSKACLLYCTVHKPHLAAASMPPFVAVEQYLPCSARPNG